MTVVTTLAVVAAFGGCAAIAATDDGCGVDLPPGDTGQVHLVNDEDQPLNLFDCSDATCSSGSMDWQSVLAGQSRSTNYELCSGTSIGLTDSHGALVGCLTLPVGESVPEHTYRASQFVRACAGAGSVHPRIN